MFPFYGSLGVMEPLDPAEYELDKFYPNLIEAFTNADGEVLCVPKDVSTLATSTTSTCSKPAATPRTTSPTTTTTTRPS